MAGSSVTVAAPGEMKWVLLRVPILCAFIFAGCNNRFDGQEATENFRCDFCL